MLTAFSVMFYFDRKNAQTTKVNNTENKADLNKYDEPSEITPLLQTKEQNVHTPNKFGNFDDMWGNKN